jgi:hypothetical protein
LAGFQTIMLGRFWVIPEVSASDHRGEGLTLQEAVAVLRAL